MRTELYQVWLFCLKKSKEARILSLAVDYNLEKLLTSAVFDFLEKQNSSRKEASTYMNSFEFGGGFCLNQMDKRRHEGSGRKDRITRTFSIEKW